MIYSRQANGIFMSTAAVFHLRLDGGIAGIPPSCWTSWSPADGEVLLQIKQALKPGARCRAADVAAHLAR